VLAFVFAGNNKNVQNSNIISLTFVLYLVLMGQILWFQDAYDCRIGQFLL